MSRLCKACPFCYWKRDWLCVTFSDVKTLVERCPLLVHLDLSDSMMLKPECFQYFKQLVFLQHLCLSRCYQISPAALVELGEIRTLKTLQVFGIVTDSSLQLLEEALPDMKINGSHFTSIARPTVGNKKSHEIWGIKCRLTLRNPSFLWSCTMHWMPWTHCVLKLLRKKVLEHLLS